MSTAERLELRYVPLDTLVRWDRNPKKHDLGALVASFTRHGFRDPPKFSPLLNGGAGGLEEGNGRADALSAMKANGEAPPRGIVADGAAWLVPVLFGIDSESMAAAEAYGVDHNNLTLAGSGLATSPLWTLDAYMAMLADIDAAGERPTSISDDELAALIGRGGGVLDLGVDTTPAADFASGEQFTPDASYEVVIKLTAAQHADAALKEDLASFCQAHGLSSKVRQA